MKLRLRRIAPRNNYTIGKLEVWENNQWKWIADTCEDKVRDLNKDGDLKDFGEDKVMHETAIPYGTYEIAMDIQSPKYSNFTKYPWSREFDGYLPRLLDVPHFEGILIHVGNKAEHSSGCILVGENKVKGQVLNSTKTFQRLMREYFIPAKNEKITLEII